MTVQSDQQVSTKALTLYFSLLTKQQKKLAERKLNRTVKLGLSPLLNSELDM